MATKYTYDPVKAAQVSSLIKSGISEEEAFQRVGIPEEAYGAYLIDDVPGSPTRGQVIKNFGGTVTVYSEEEERARAAADAQKVAEQEAARELRNKEIAAEREKNLERLKQEREAEKEAAKKGWVEEETKAETTGPADTRKTSSVVVTGGAERVTKMTPEMADWTDKKNIAYKQDQAATDAAREDFYRSKGLENASRGEKFKALQEAKKSGEFKDVTTAQDAVGEPPRTQYTTEVIQPNSTGEQPPNDGTQTEGQAAKSSAAGQTAEAAVTNDNPPPSAGVGNVDSDPNVQPLDDKESAKVAAAKNGQTDTAVEASQTSATPTTKAPSEAAATETTSSITSATTPATATNDTQKELSKLPASAYTNKLHNFTGYTYRITLFLLTQEDFKSLSDNPASFDPKHALISSGGGYATPSQTTRSTTMMGGFLETTTPGRHPDFLEDFFIENLSFTSIVGMNARSKASNSFDIAFNIIEPYGMTLLDRLLSACETTAKCANYIEQPYLLQVDFLSNVSEAFKTDPNKPAGILIDRKRFPISLVELKIKPSTGGTEYRCRAIPYNHTALSQSSASLPINMAVEAKTVGDFFDADTSLDLAFKGPGDVDDNRIESELNKWKQNWPSEFPPSVAEIESKRTELRSSLVSGKSLPSAYNSYQKSVAEGKLFSYPQNVIAFNIDPIFKDSPLSDPDITEVDNQPMTPSLAGIVATTSGYVNPDYKTKQIYNLHYGSDIVTVIDRIMQSSKYIKDQVLDSKKAIEESQQAATNSGSATRKDDNTLNKYKFLDWYKIIPQVRLLNFDPTRNAYSRQLIFSVVPYKTANPYHPDFKKTKIYKGKLARSYKYLYTGLNTDILSLDIDFDTAFYTQLTSFQDSKRRDGSNYSSGSPFSDPIQARDGEGTSRVMDPPMKFNVVGSEQQGSSSVNRGKDPKDQAVGSLTKSIYPGARGDMLNIRVKIVGDPGYIKQDDIYYNPMSSDYKEFTRSVLNQNEQAPINPNTGQILFDQEQVFVQLLTKSAVDIDDTTGITNKQVKLSNGRTTDSTFSGVYRVMSVKSEFNKGKFEQTLELIKMPNDMLVEDIPATSTAVAVTTTTPPGTPTNSTPTPPPAAAPTPIANGPSADLKAAGNGPTTNPTSANSGQGAISTGDQPSAASPSNANDTNTAPQEKAQPSQTDSIRSLSELQATFNTIAADTMKDKFTSDTTPEEAIANGMGSFYVRVAQVNQEIVAARSLPTEKEQVEERIRIRTAWSEYMSTVAGTMRDSVVSPMLDIKPHPRDFSTLVLNFTGSLKAYYNDNKERLANNQKKLSQLK